MLINFGMFAEIKGESMCLDIAVNLINFEQLTQSQKEDLNKIKQNLQKELDAIDAMINTIDQKLSSANE